MPEPRTPAKTVAQSVLGFVGLSVAAGVLATALVVVVRRSLPPNELLAGVGAFLAFGSVPALFLAWLGSPVEYTRHAIPFLVLLPLGMLLVFLAAADEAPEPIEPPRPASESLRLRRRHP